MSVAARLHEAVAAVCPVLTVRITGNSGEAVPAPSATAEQIAAAQTAVANFDWSDSAQTAWESQQNRTKAVSAIDARADEVGRVVRAALRLINASLNQIRQQVGLPTITWQQVRQQLAQMIARGQGDPES